MSDEVGILTEAGHAIIRFPNPTTWVKLSPQQAFEIAGGLMRAAYEAKNGKAPRSGFVESLQDEVVNKFTDELRQRLITRMILMLMSMDTQNKRIDYQARQIVDTILTELA